MPARTAKARVLLIGDASRAEFQAAREWLGAETELTAAASCAATARQQLTTSSSPPQWIVLTAPHRSCAELCGVEDLHAAAPLARLVTLLGAWCEGETRSGRPLRGVTRASWLTFSPRAVAAFDLTTGESDYAGWRLPRTATPLDISLQTRTPIATRTTRGLPVAVLAASREDYEALADVLATCGCEAHWRRNAGTPGDEAGLLWQTTSLSPATRRVWHALRDSAPARPVVALLDFPRWHETAELLAEGAAAVLAKPFLLGDLRHALASAGLIADSGELQRTA